MAESKNTSGDFRSASRGLISEIQVVKLMATKGWALSFHRLRTRIAEVDLVFENNKNILLIEVKTLSDRWRADQRLSQKQIDKLKLNRAALSFFSKKKNIDALVAWVEKGNIVTFCKLD